MGMRECQLFGGAVVASLPALFRVRRVGEPRRRRPLTAAQDASALREVPDNQEVWVDAESDASLIVELVELAEARRPRLALPRVQPLRPARAGEHGRGPLRQFLPP